MNPEQMQINDCMDVHRKTCCLLVHDHATNVAGRSVPTSEGTACGVAEEVAHEEREGRRERSMRLHGSGRRVAHVQSNQGSV